MFKVRALAMALGLAVMTIGFQAQPATVSAASTTEAQSVINFAKNQLGKSFRLGADGLRRYDCSGLVWRSFYERGLASRIGGNRTSRGYYAWGKEHGRITSNPRKGDLVVWGYRGKPVSHVGIYLGVNRYGHRMALSALTGGVAIHRVRGINVPVRAYIRINLDR